MQLSEPVQHPPAHDPRTGRVYVGAGPPSFAPVGSDDPDPFGGVVAFESTDGTVAWRSVTRAPVANPPFVHDGRVHLTTASNSYRDRPRVVAFDQGGTRQWERTDLFTPHFVAGRDGTVFAGDSTDAPRSSGRTLYALAPDGSIEWESEAGDAMGAQLVDGRLLYRAGVQAMAAYDPATGDRHWQREGRALRAPNEPPLVAGGHCFVTPPELDDEGAIIARSVATGAEQWRYDPPWTDNFVPTAVAALPTPADADYSIVCTEYGGTVFALDDTGSERWRFGMEATNNAGPIVGESVYVTDDTATLYALDPADGSERWRQLVPDLAAPIATADGPLVFESSEERSVLLSYGSDGAERWRFESDRFLHEPIVTGNRAYATARDGSVFAFDLS